MSDPEATNTALAIAGATFALQCELLETLLKNKVISPSDALAAVQQARTKLEGDGKPGGVRASLFLELIEQDIERHMTG